MLDPADVFHTGFVVPDVDAAMAELAGTFDLTWAPVTRITMELRFPDGPREVAMQFTYSVQEPHIELLAAVPHTPWGQADGPTAVGLQAAHHLGVWSDDVAGDSAALVAAGAPLLVTYDHAGEGARGFAYHRLPSGVLVELVDRSRAADFERWFAGGSFVPAS